MTKSQEEKNIEMARMLNEMGSREVPHPGGIRVRIYPTPRPAPPDKTDS